MWTDNDDLTKQSAHGCKFDGHDHGTLVPLWQPGELKMELSKQGCKCTMDLTGHKVSGQSKERC